MKLALILTFSPKEKERVAGACRLVDDLSGSAVALRSRLAVDDRRQSDVLYQSWLQENCFALPET